VLEACRRELRAIADPDEIERRARDHQRRRIEQAGGLDAVIAAGVKVPYTPAPDEFDPAPVEARERSRKQRPAT
jgi:hypothetical protein